MPETPVTSAAPWMLLEQAIERLHAAARRELDPRAFYRHMLREAEAALAAGASTAWRRRIDGRLELIVPAAGFDQGSLVEARQRTLEHGVASVTSVAAHDGGEDYDVLLCPVLDIADGGEEGGGRAALAGVAVIELWFSRGASPFVQQGRLDFAAAISSVAADFHAFDDLRRLRRHAERHGQAAEWLRRVQRPRGLVGVAFEIANEGRRALDCDRLSVLVRRRSRWRLLSVSGASEAPRHGDVARTLEALAEQAARWGEPIDHPPPAGDGSVVATDGLELPPAVQRALEQQLECSHARGLTVVPVAFREQREESSKDSAQSYRSNRRPFDAVLVAERFQGGHGDLRAQLVELAELCSPALARAATLDRFPVGLALRWSDRITALRAPGGVRRPLAVIAAAAIAAAFLALPVDFDVEAPATLHAAVERDLFAAASGAVDEVRAAHGQIVKAGEVLLVLHDPELSLQLQQLQGEIETSRKRLDALVVTRTDRKLPERESDVRLPLSAEQRQLEERLASLSAQAEVLEARRKALTLRSPLAGQVLTRDVQSLLQTRPVERGQVLLTIADASSGWELIADVPQRHIGHVLNAYGAAEREVLASVRLAGDVSRTHAGRVVEISSSAPLDAAGLEDPAPPVAVRIGLVGRPPQARPGMAAAVRIHCGRRALAYVWLHDVGATIYRWLTF
ncbi:MAG: HlyD family efflux transporter periplasmic adaptor subunit [Pirellulales bacterium]|nr:HlyD family efflux transporter periplasmic adaptor subunit [Pirellulales bacterium]